ncbi:MAG: aspartyl protease family protein [archaeon]|nr:aspartyl protease family protein [archaeon]
MSIRFQYVEFKGRFLPIIPIDIEGLGEWTEFKAFVDSGAGYSVFHSDVAEILGIKLEDGKKDYVTVGDGSQIIVYIHEVKVKIGGKEFAATIGFSRRLGIGFNILGQKDVFEKFKICFDKTDKIVEFHPKED